MIWGFAQARKADPSGAGAGEGAATAAPATAAPKKGSAGVCFRGGRFQALLAPLATNFFEVVAVLGTNGECSL